MLDTISDIWNDLSSGSQDVLILIFVAFAIWVIRRYALKSIISRLHTLALETETQWDEIILGLIDKPLNYMWLAGMILVTTLILDLQDSLEAFLNRIGSSLIIFAFYLLAYRLVDYFTRNPLILSRTLNFPIDQKLIPFIQTGARIVLIGLAFVVIMNEWGYDVNGFIAGLGIGGLAIALAAQDTLANLFGFTTIISDQPFVEGDYIRSSTVEGTVITVGLRSTRIRQLDQAFVTVPNSVLTSDGILNWSRLSKRRFDTTLGITYDADAQTMRRLLDELREMLEKRDHVQSDSVVARFINFGDSALEILIRCYINLADWGEFTAEKEAINLEIMELVSNIGLSMAFPTQSLYIEHLPESPQNPFSAE